MNRRKPDGGFYYPNKDIMSVLPVLLLTLPSLDVGALGPASRRMIARFLSEIGAPSPTAESMGDFEERLEAFWKRSPPNPELVDELNALMQDVDMPMHNDARRFAPPPTSPPAAPSPLPGIKAGPGHRVRLLRWGAKDVPGGTG